MRAEIISVGTELLLGQITDTNATYLARLLAAHGVDVLFKQTVGDNAERVRGAVQLALGRADLVVMTGGLGPTEDDLTAEAVADAIGLPMIYDQAVADGIAAFFARRRRAASESIFRQARIPAGSQVIPNRRGTAPGLIVPANGRTVFLFPGVPLAVMRRCTSPTLASGATVGLVSWMRSWTRSSTTDSPRPAIRSTRDWITSVP